jgi:hypothetical protein
LASHWLDPAEAVGADLHSDPPSELPPSVRQFGFVPSVADLRHGDVVLVCSVQPPAISSYIQRLQRRAGFEEQHAQWHHAAVYIGDERICEAQTSGMRVESIYRYSAGAHRIRIRRDQQLSEAEGIKIALEAATRLNYKYGWKTISGLWFQSKKGWKNNAAAEPKRFAQASICSELFADAHGVVTRRTLVPTATMGVSPAHLSACKDLVDVAVKWLALGTSQTLSGGNDDSVDPDLGETAEIQEGIQPAS